MAFDWELHDIVSITIAFLGGCAAWWCVVQPAIVYLRRAFETRTFETRKKPLL